MRIEEDTEQTDHEVINLADPWVDPRLDIYVSKFKEIAQRSSRELVIAAERNKVTRQLQDLAGRTFHEIALSVGKLIDNAETGELKNALAKIRNLAARAVVETRQAGYELSFLDLKSKGFVRSVKSLGARFEKETGIPLGIKVDVETEVSREVQTVLFKVIHEALTNVERHARASAVVISISTAEDRVGMTIRDDGVGLGQRQGRDWLSAAEFGIGIMARSVREIGGTFTMKQAEPRGIEIRVVAPTA